MNEGLSRERGINGGASLAGRGPFMPRKLLTDRSDLTLLAAGVGWFLIHPGCLTASAGCGAAPHGEGLLFTKEPLCKRIGHERKKR